MKHYSTIIIGAGTTGLSAANTLLKNNHDFVIIENSSGETLCAKSGCMPSKSLIEAAKKYNVKEHFSNIGVKNYENISIDISKVLEHVRKQRDYFVDSVLKKSKIFPIIKGEAKFLNKNTLDVDGEKYSADNIIIATGSKPRVPNIFKNIEDKILTTDNLFEQENLPENIALIGMGAIGVEMGQALSRLGIKITGFSNSYSFAAISDPEVKKESIRIFEKDIDLKLGAKIKEIAKTKKGFAIKYNDEIFKTDKILVCAGRAPNIENLGLEDIGVKFKNEAPIYNFNTMQIEDYPIYIAGDANNGRAILHESSDEGVIAAQNILDKANKQKRRTKLNIIFTDPPIARVGQNYGQIKKNNHLVESISYERQGKAIIRMENNGIVSIYASKEGQILGAEMIAPEADHLIHLFALAIEKNISVDDFLSIPYYHPTLEEAIRKALRNIKKQIIKL